MSPPTLAGPRHGPKTGGPPKQLVVLLHGVGADGNDLIGLAPILSEALPDALFVSPDGAEPFDMAPFGRQWFSLRDRSPATLLEGVEKARAAVDPFLDAELAASGLDESALAMIGFSQGTMVTLHTALRRPRPAAALVGFSGALIGADRLAGEIVSKPPTLLIHGEDDDVVPFQALAAAEAGLLAAGVPVETFARPGLGHGIDEAGLIAAVKHLARSFGLPRQRPATGRRRDG